MKQHYTLFPSLKSVFVCVYAVIETFTLGGAGSAGAGTLQVDSGVRTRPFLRPQLERKCAVQVKLTKTTTKTLFMACLVLFSGLSLLVRIIV